MPIDYSTEFIKTSYPSPAVILVELSRAPVNAFHDAFWTTLGETFDKISDDGEIRVIVLASRMPKAFTAGLDLGAAKESLTFGPDSAREGLRLRKHIEHFQHCISAIERCTQPVIGASHGIAFGLGIDILCACDIRYAATSSVFSIKEVDVGMAADIGTLARLPKITGNESLLRELALTARTFGVAEAVKLGFVSKAVEGSREEVVAAALQTAKLIATKSPIAVMGTKHLLLHSRDHTVQDNLDYTVAWSQVMLQAPDLADAMTAFATKKAPVFKPLSKL